jgi:hypothetical protein
MFRPIAAAMFLVFALAAFVQWNDPDPSRRRGRADLAAALRRSSGALSGGRAVPAARPRGCARVRVHFVEDADVSDEEAREALGLAICAAWMVVLIARARVERRRPGRSAPVD